MKNPPSVSSHSEQHSPGWHRKLLFNGLLLVIVAIVVFSLWGRFASVSVPAFVTGTLVEVAAPNAATVARVAVERNAEVRRGDLVAVLQNETLDARVAAASDELEELIRSRNLVRNDASRVLRRLSINERIADLRTQLAQLDMEMASLGPAIRGASETLRLRREALERAEALFAERALTASELDSRRLALTEARATLEEVYSENRQLGAKRKGLLESIELYQQQLSNLEKEVENALAELEATIGKQRGVLGTLLAEQRQLTLRAEAGGVVMDVAKHEGERVSAGERILTISTGDELRVEAYLEPQQRSSVSPGQPVEIRVDSAGRTKLAGRVQGVLPVLKTMPVDTGTTLTLQKTYAIILIEFDQPELAKREVQAGQRVTAVFLPKR